MPREKLTIEFCFSPFFFLNFLLEIKNAHKFLQLFIKKQL